MIIFTPRPSSIKSRSRRCTLPGPRMRKARLCTKAEKTHGKSCGPMGPVNAARTRMEGSAFHLPGILSKSEFGLDGSVHLGDADLPDLFPHGQVPGQFH